MVRTHDATQLPMLMTGNEQRVYADRAYDSKSIFNLLRYNGTEAIIPLIKNFSILSRGSLEGKGSKGDQKTGGGSVEKCT